MRGRNIIILLIVIIEINILSGCGSYSDINKLLFVTTVIVDVDKDNKPIIYLEAFKPTRSSNTSSERGKRLLFRGTGKTIFEAIRDVHMSSSEQFNYTQNKIVMYTQRAAAHGIDNFLDVFDREQEFLVRPYIAVLIGEPEEFLNSNFKSEEYLGIYLKDLIDNEGASSRAVKMQINEYFTKRVMGSKTSIVTAIDLKKGQLQDIIEIRGGAVIKQDKMVYFMPKTDGLGYNFLMNRLNMGSLEITNPDAEDSFVTLRVLKSTTKTEINYDGNVIHLYKNIKLKTSISDVQKYIEFSNGELEKIKNKSRDNIIEACNSVFNKYKSMDLDIFDIKEEFYRKYPNAKVENPLKITEVKVKVDENIEGSPDKKEFPN